MRDPIFEHEIQDPMQTLLNVVRANGPDGANSVIRMIHHLASLASQDAPQAFRETLGSLQEACMVAMGGEEIPAVPVQEVPTYRKGRGTWDPAGLRCNLEAARRVGMRHGSFGNPSLKQWLDYTIQALEHDLRRTA